MSENLMNEVDSGRLELTMSFREAIIKDQMAKGIPDNKSDREFLSGIMSDLDRTILAKAKIKSDDTNNKSKAEVSKIMADILKRHKVGGVRTENPTLPKDIVIDDIVPGELDIGTIVISGSE